MPSRIAIRAEAARLSEVFQAAGATLVDADILQPAERLLDLYGEDIRARAYVTSGRDGEAMLRPDFTVPVTIMHLENGKGTGRYTYSGEVFRQQDDAPDRASEYVQVGFELFDAADLAAADAEVFRLFSEIAAPYGLKPATGDIGLIKSAVSALSTTDDRKAALLRHLWRPVRFHRLLDQFAGRVPLEGLVDEPATPAVEIGLRTRDEVVARRARVASEADVANLSETEAAILDELLRLQETLPNVLSRLTDFVVDLPGIAPAVDAFEARMNALAKVGIDVGNLSFEGSYGRTTLEYYDGFVFGFAVPGRRDLPPVASGGRYDALTAVLGKGSGVPAVGGVVRPAMLLELEAAQ